LVSCGVRRKAGARSAPMHRTRVDRP
jgi:hypothetical protein